MGAEPAALRVEEREERLVHAARVGEALLDVERHRALQEGDQLGGDVRPEELDRGVLAGLHAPERLERGRRGEGVHPRQHLVEHRAEGEEVAPRVDLSARRVLRAHVAVLALEALAPRVVAGAASLAPRLDRAARLRDPEVGHLHLALERDEDVLRGHVAMDDVQRLVLLVAAAMRVVEALRDLGRDVDRHLDRDLELAAAAAREDRREVEPVHVLHRHVIGIGRRHAAGHGPGREAKIEHLHHVRVREPHRELRLVDEHRDELVRLGELREDALDDDDLLEALDAVALGLEDLGHPALAEPLEEAVAPERRVHEGRKLAPSCAGSASIECRAAAQ